MNSSSVLNSFAVRRGHLMGGCLGRMRTDPLGFYSSCRGELGDYVRVRVVPHVWCYLLTHPDAVEHVLLTNHRNYRKPDIFYKSVGLLVGDGLFTSEGETWIRQRRLAQPAFHAAYLAEISPLMVAAAEKFVEEQSAGAGTPIDIAAAMMEVGLRISGTTLVSADISGDTSEIGAAFRIAFAHIGYRLNSTQLVPPWFPTRANRRFARAKSVLDRAVAQLICARQQSAQRPRDLLTMLLSERSGQMDMETTRQLRDEVLTLLAGGHENMGAALAWTWYLLARHRDVQEQLFEEISGQLRGRSPRAEDLAQMPLLTAVFQEVLRLYPPGWGELRESIDADEICGYSLPRKALVVLCQWVTHRHPDFWADPDAFKPERFLGNSADRHRFAYFPFGGGPRICIGVQMAMMEGPLVIATILQKFRVESCGEEEVEPDASFTLKPRGGLRVVLRRRE